MIAVSQKNTLVPEHRDRSNDMFRNESQHELECREYVLPLSMQNLMFALEEWMDLSRSCKVNA